MKVGTDGVLLGAWVNVDDCNTILDIGAGTGVISLMLAQKSTAEITAVEIDTAAKEECEMNFANSPWHDRMKVLLTDFKLFDPSLKFDLIVSNPPFFSKQNTSSARTTARSELQLTLEELISKSTQLLSKTGRIALIYPSERLDEIKHSALKNRLHLTQVCYIQGSPTSPIKRVLVELSKEKRALKETNLCIELHQRHQYSLSYTSLLKDYLTIF